MAWVISATWGPALAIPHLLGAEVVGVTAAAVRKDVTTSLQAEQLTAMAHTLVLTEVEEEPVGATWHLRPGWQR